MLKKTIDILLIARGEPNNLSTATNIDKLINLFRDLNINVFLISYCNKDNIKSLSNDKIFDLKFYKNRFMQFFFPQIFVTRQILKLSKEYDIKLIFFIFGGDLLLVPFIISKILANRIMIRSDGRPSIYIKKYYREGSLIKLWVFEFIEEINYRLADKVLTECNFMIYENNFAEYNASSAHLYVDLTKFKYDVLLNSRKYDIGYIGRLSEEKGIINFIESVPILLNNNSDLNILILGDGPLREQIQNYINDNNLKMNVSLLSWISHNDIPKYLNNIKLLIIPSNREGLPNVALEAMACNTPVLATNVGGIPEIITDGKTGFILRDNSPENIAMNVIKIFTSHDLEDIAKNARIKIERDFSYEAALINWSEILTK